MPLPVDRRTLAPSSEGGTGVRLFSDTRRILYARGDEDEGFAVMAEEPGTGWKRRMAAYQDPVSALAVSPEGDFVAYVIGSAMNPPEERAVAWARTTAPREAGRVSGTAFGWSTNKAALYVVDAKERALVRHDL